MQLTKQRIDQRGQNKTKQKPPEGAYATQTNGHNSQGHQAHIRLHKYRKSRAPNQQLTIAKAPKQRNWKSKTPKQIRVEEEPQSRSPKKRAPKQNQTEAKQEKKPRDKKTIAEKIHPQGLGTPKGKNKGDTKKKDNACAHPGREQKGREPRKESQEALQEQNQQGTASPPKQPKRGRMDIIERRQLANKTKKGRNDHKNM
ncbi:hypothetical protein U1Q18_002832 [Sarracenia purpurea var. burkii]